MAVRERDVIDVNRRWAVWRGTRRDGIRVGTVLSHSRVSAMREARRERPTGLLFVEEDCWS